MTGITFANNTLTYQVPENWNEMTLSQTKFVFGQFFKLQRNSILYERFYIELLNHFIPFDTNSKPDIDIAEHLLSIAESLFHFVLSKSDSYISLNYTGVVQLFPLIQHQGIEYSAPLTLCWGMKFGQFLDCLSVVRMFSNSQDSIYLDILIRKIYEIEDSELITMRFIDKIIIYHWFCACVKYIQEDTIEIDGLEVNFAPLFRDGRSSVGQKIDGWTSILFDVSAAQLFGTAVDVKNTDLFEVLQYLLKVHYDVRAQRIK